MIEDTKSINCSCGHYEYECLLNRVIARVSEKYFGYINQVELVSINKKTPKCRLFFKLCFPGGESDAPEAYEKDNINNDDGGFMSMFSKAYNEYKNKLEEVLSDYMNPEKAESVLESYNLLSGMIDVPLCGCYLRSEHSKGLLDTDNYLFLLSDLIITPSCNCVYHYNDGDVYVTNNVLITLNFTKEDISMYKPGGTGAINCEINYNKISDSVILS